MKKAYLDLIKFGLANNAEIKVFYDDPDDPDLDFSTGYKAIKENVEATADIICLELRDKTTKEHISTVSIIWGFGMDPEETVPDWTSPLDEEKAKANLVNLWWDKYCEYENTLEAT